MFAKDGYSSMALASVVLAIVTYCTYSFVDHWFAYVIYTCFFVMWGIVIYFFRDPDRYPPVNEHLIISPADGKVVLIKEIEEGIYVKTKATQI
ncbi:MAG: phosphatidylserine decarboxylase, partial [Balneolales bacterium]|nr:phosphatidylserine decarboxylase [Balneolales bacterium]